MARKKSDENEIQELSMDEALKKIDSYIEKLEDRDTPIEEAIKTYEEGISLIKLCSEKLDGVEHRLKVIREEEA